MTGGVRAGHFVIAFFAALALVFGSTVWVGLKFWLFSAMVIAGAGALIYVLYKRGARRWLQQSYRLLADAKLSELRPRVEAELAKGVSGVDRSICEQLWGETLFWSGEFERAYETACAIDTSRMPELWRAATVGLRVTSSLWGGHVERARELLETNRALLTKRPGLHHLEAMVALKSGDAKTAREKFTRLQENWERPPLVRGALALIEAQIALGLGENADAQLALAQQLGGESWVPQAARALTTPRSA
jgi:hypothetical protein